MKSFAEKLSKSLALYGGWGLLGISFLDSVGISMPGVKDLLLIYLSAQRPGLAWVYAIAVTIGTVTGTLVIYGIGRSGARLVSKNQESVGRASRWLKRNEFVTMLVASLLPPPLPFKPFSLAAGALRVNIFRFTAALLVGGAIRFGAEAWFGVRYGVGGADYLKRNIVWLSLPVVGIVVALAIVNRLFSKTLAEPIPAGPAASAPSHKTP
ncbi:MAG: YqaA family protein [Deltaproteobacteria bacterium]